MNHCCLQIDVTLKVTAEEWFSRTEKGVATMRELPGLVWKLWLEPVEGKAGGLYLFKNLAAAKAYAEGPIVAGLRASTMVENVTVRLLPINDSLSRRTFGLPDEAGTIGSSDVATLGQAYV